MIYLVYLDAFEYGFQIILALWVWQNILQTQLRSYISYKSEFSFRTNISRKRKKAALFFYPAFTIHMFSKLAPYCTIVCFIFQCHISVPGLALSLSLVIILSFFSKYHPPLQSYEADQDQLLSSLGKLQYGPLAHTGVCV